VQFFTETGEAVTSLKAAEEKFYPLTKDCKKFVAPSDPDPEWDSLLQNMVR
jgi:hypothetical protein